MAKFNFKAKNKAGEIKEGYVEAQNLDAAAEMLQKSQLFPIDITKGEGSGSLVSLKKDILKYYDRVTEKEQVVFFRQLAVLIEARVPVVSSLTAIADQTTSKYLKKILGEIISDIEDGMPFSNALEKHRDVFPKRWMNIIRAGEASGNLKKSIDYVANNIEKNYTLVSRVRGAMMYPGIVMIVFFIIGFLVITFILPKLTVMIKELNADVPWYTRLVMTVGDFMASYWWAVAVIILGFVGGIIYYIQSEDGKKEWDRVKINLPIVGPIFRGVYIARFAENLAVLLTGGIPIIQSLKIVSSVIGNTVFEKVFLQAAEEVKIGGNMSNVLRKSPIIPPVVAHMVKIGEDSGQIDSVLGHIARFYEQETEMSTKNLSTLIEPILMIVIGIGVGFMAVAVLMPIYNIAGQIK